MGTADELVHTPTEHEAVEPSHALPRGAYFLVFAILIVLTGVTIFAAFLDLGPLNTVTALVIAVTKATLVILYFMHVRHSSRLTRLVIVAGFFWLLILLALTMGDYLTRDWMPAPRGWEQM